MKAIGFFFAVFLSMLAVFLLATGEVRRWFGASKDSSGEPMEIVRAADSTSPGKNTLVFHFYDVERGEKRFTIRAEFDQNQSQLKDPFEESAKLALRNGVIEVPIPSPESPPTEEANPPAAEGSLKTSPGAQPKKLLLEFKSAVYEGKGKSVHLQEGKGTTDNGNEFFFEELAFSVVGDGEFRLRSAKPVSIRSPSYSVMSPQGLEGTIMERGRQEFTLLPPVSALVDPAGAELGVLGAQGAAPKGQEAEDRKPKVAVTCRGPLSLKFSDQGQEAQAGQPAQTSIVFQKDVVLYPVPRSADLASLPPPQHNRFECQRLELELQNRGTQPVPVKASATWEGGRVKAYFQERPGEAVYTIDGDRLEWTRGSSTPSSAPAPAGSIASVSGLPGEAVLLGKPILQGRDLELTADHAKFRLEDSKLLLESVQGTFRDPGQEPKEDRSGKKQGEGRAAEDVDAFGVRGGGQELTGDVREKSGGKEGSSVRPRLPQWVRFAADEAEFLLASGEENAGDPQGWRLSKFLARSGNPDGLKIESCVAPRRDEGTPPQNGQRSFHATGKTLTYLVADDRLTLEGTEEVKPRFVQGEDWIEAQRVNISQKKNTVSFEGEVRAHVANAQGLGDALFDPKTQKPQTAPAKAAGAEAPTGAQPAEKASVPIEIEAAFLGVRYDQFRNAVQEAVARGSPGRPVVVTSITDPWFSFRGPELHWDQTAEVVQMVSSATAQTPGEDALAIASRRPRIELLGCDLQADTIVFYRKAWKAVLTDHAVLRTFRKDAGVSRPSLQVETGKAEIEFFESLAKHDEDREGPLLNIGYVKSLHAYRSPERLIEIQSDTFVGHAEESTWDSSRRELRFFGTGMQDIELQREDLRGPVRAREIVYDEAKSRLHLRGEVQGELVQSGPPEPRIAGASQARLEPASHAGGAASGTVGGTLKRRQEPLVWRFDTNALEVQLRAEAGGGRLGLETVKARDKVNLRNEERGLQLRGDDLLYEHDSRKVHIFSPDGRPQTLVWDEDKAAGGAASAPEQGTAPDRKEDAASERAHKIVAQDIWLLFYEASPIVSQSGGRNRWLLVQFERDVIASFHPRATQGGKAKKDGLGDTWRMVSEKLTLLVDPGEAPTGEINSAARQDWARKIVPWGVAAGKVIFSSGEFQASADRAVYDDTVKRITLYGAPARLSRNNNLVLAAPEIIATRVAGGIGLDYKKGDGKGSPAGLPPISPAVR